MRRWWKELRSERGQGMSEYLIIVALVAIAAIGVVTVFGRDVRELFSGTTDSLAGNQATNTAVKANVRRPRCAAAYAEYDKTAPDQVVERLRDATVAIINKVVLRDATLAQLPKLKLIAMAATGYDCIEVESCRRRGIALANIRNYAVHTVPEHVFAMVLALRRNLLAYRHDVEQGEWQRSD